MISARLRRPQDGLFTGTVDALDTVHNTYRITFDRPGLGTHSVPDYEVLVSTVVDTVKFLNFGTSENFAVFYLKFRKRDQTSGYFVKKKQIK